MNVGLFSLLMIIQEKEIEISATTIIVDDDGTPGVDCNYTHIQWAIENARIGDTIFVKNGTYYENVRVNKTIYLIGEDRNNTIIDGSGGGVVVSIEADYVNISHLRLQNGTSNGLYLFDINNFTCRNMTVLGKDGFNEMEG